MRIPSRLEVRNVCEPLPVPVGLDGRGDDGEPCDDKDADGVRIVLVAPNPHNDAEVLKDVKRMPHLQVQDKGHTSS